MQKKGWNVSFSVGIVTFETLPMDIKEAMKIADELMYTVKHNRKNDVAFKVWSGKV
jgi:GGDEF domain-containing protein